MITSNHSLCYIHCIVTRLCSVGKSNIFLWIVICVPGTVLCALPRLPQVTLTSARGDAVTNRNISEATEVPRGEAVSQCCTARTLQRYYLNPGA